MTPHYIDVTDSWYAKAGAENLVRYFAKSYGECISILTYWRAVRLPEKFVLSMPPRQLPSTTSFEIVRSQHSASHTVTPQRRTTTSDSRKASTTSTRSRVSRRMAARATSS